MLAVCADGFTGQNCIDTCDDTFYGRLCSFRCNCTKENCHHIYGCETDESRRFRIATNTVELSKLSEATTKYTDDFQSLYVNSRPDSQLTKMQSTVTNSVQQGIAIDSISDTSVKTFTITQFTTSGNFPGNNTLIIVIGGLIAFFLCVLSIQACIKLRICRKRKTRRVTKQQQPFEYEETYEEINEAQEATFTNYEDKTNSSQQTGKYYELKTLKQDPIMPMAYKNIDNTLKWQYIDGDINEKNDELCSSLLSYDSNESCNAYLKPMNNADEKHKYFKVIDTNEKPENLNEDCLVKTTEDVKLCPHNIEALQDINIDENGQSSRDLRDNTYLDAINEKNVSHDFSGENLEVHNEMSDNTYLDVINESLDKDAVARKNSYEEINGTRNIKSSKEHNVTSDS